jgi:hypothetical protein
MIGGVGWSSDCIREKTCMRLFPSPFCMLTYFFFFTPYLPTLLPSTHSPMIMFSGLLIERDSVPVWLAWIEKISIVNYAFDALMSQQMYILPKGQPEQVQKFIQFDPDQMGRNVGLLWVLTVVFQLLTYVNLAVRLRVSRAVM